MALTPKVLKIATEYFSVSTVGKIYKVRQHSFAFKAGMSINFLLLLKRCEKELGDFQDQQQHACAHTHTHAHTNKHTHTHTHTHMKENKVIFALFDLLPLFQTA